jgi:lipoyl(octanoyl) transferase
MIKIMTGFATFITMQCVHQWRERTMGSGNEGAEAFRIEQLGVVDYDTAICIQLEERDRVMRGQSPGTIFILEHDPAVITLGRNADPANLRVTVSEAAAAGYQVRRSSRGGDVTVHEQGQMVAYFVIP